MPDQYDNIQRTLGELRGDVKAILREMERDRNDSREARRVMYERIERVEESVVMTGQVAAQARDKIKEVETLADDTKDKLTALDNVVTKDMKPQTDRLKNIGLKGGGFLAGAALVGGFAAQPVWAAVANALDKVFKP